jgi:bifunctional DNA-binding transcriptional regulator/antitoxin component of YhaV-PrlF toxin-antitoxin module
VSKVKPFIEGAVWIGAKNQITIPHRISKALRLKKGDLIFMCLVDRRIEMIPARLIPKDQLWFWTPEWQRKEREADEDIAQGRIRESASVDELLKDLKSEARRGPNKGS